MNRAEGVWNLELEVFMTCLIYQTAIARCQDRISSSKVSSVFLPGKSHQYFFQESLIKCRDMSGKPDRDVVLPV